MTTQTLIQLARKFAEMGDAVGEQAEAVICKSADIDDQNPNAMEMVVEFLQLAAEAARMDGDDESADEFEEAGEEIWGQL